jgi:hypothetical protein
MKMNGSKTEQVPILLPRSPKGQLNSELIYEVIVSPKMPTKNYKDFFPTKQTRIVAKKTAYNHQKITKKKCYNPCLEISIAQIYLLTGVGKYTFVCKEEVLTLKAMYFWKKEIYHNSEATMLCVTWPSHNGCFLKFLSKNLKK